jgi:hypothetical protein
MGDRDRLERLIGIAGMLNPDCAAFYRRPHKAKSACDKDSMGNDGKPGLVRWDRRHWHCMEETNAPPHEGID